jgi:hypothetical protein
LYSFGCVLYELLAGRPPFVAQVPMAIMRMHLQESPVPMRDIRSDLPGGLPELVDRLLEKDRDARPSDAGYVVRILASIRDNLERGDWLTPEHEADRSTFLADSGGSGGSGETILPDGPGPEAYRSTVLAGDPRQGTAAPGSEAYRPTVLAGDAGYPQGSSGQAPFPAGYQADGGMPPLQPLGQPASNGSGRRGKDKGKRGNRNGGPQTWPSARPRPPRRRWAGVLSSLLTFAIVAGIAAYVWNKTHHTLQVTDATVLVANPGKIGCDSTVDVVGTIYTNGNGGPITYQWTKDGENQPVSTVTAASGQQQVRVDLRWLLRGKGTHQGVAILQVFTPNVVSQQSATFTYKCAS